MAHLKKSKKGYYSLYERILGKERCIKYIGKDPAPYYASLEKGAEINEATKRYPDLATRGSGQAILAEYKRRTLQKQNLPDKLYKTIVIDPPWPVEKIIRKVVPITQQYDFEYAVMTLEEIAALPLPDFADKEGCHVYLWATEKFLPMAFDILRQWGVNYIFTLVWHKNGGFQPFGLPQYNCEFVLFGKIGSLPFLTTRAFNCCFTADRREHSRKPQEFDDLIRRVSPEPRLEWFGRELKAGFDTIGAEKDKFNEMP